MIVLIRILLRVVLTRVVLRYLARRYRPSTSALLALGFGLAVAFVRGRSLREEARRHVSAHLRAGSRAR
jgi:hypothetical protein